MSKLTALKVIACMVPLSHPHKTASGIIASSPLLLIDITNDEGITGHGLLFTYTQAALRPVGDLTKAMGELIVGRDDSPLATCKWLNQRFRLLGTQGLVGMAIAGIDMALWDIQARRAGLPLFQLLGASRNSIPAYGGVGYDGIKGSADAAESFARQGFKGVKAKIGYPTVDEDIAVICAMRAAVGPDVSIMVDYNQSLDLYEANQRLSRLDECDITWVEEPIQAQDFDTQAKVREQAKTPIQAGENWWGIMDMHKSLRAQASDLVMPDVMKIGGVTGWMQAAQLADLHQLRVSNHLWPELSTQLLCATPTAHWLEYADWWNAILETPQALVDGCAKPSESPGNGLQWNRAKVAEFEV